MSNENHIFISFASQERDLAKELQKILQSAFANPVSVFVSDTTITAGEIWENEIKGKIEKAKLVLVLCSHLSIKRPWVNFECGAATVNEARIIALCHSGLRVCDCVTYAKWAQVMDVHSKAFISDLLAEVKSCFNINPKSENFELNYFKERFLEVYKKESEIKEVKQRPLVELSWTEGEKGENSYELKIKRSDSEPKKVSEELDEGKWRSDIEGMRQFLANPKTGSKLEAGIAIGVQNCLVDEGEIYVGIRMKSGNDFYSSSMSVAKGSFNTGYKLLEEGDEKNFASMEALQDLFVAMPKHIKQTVHKDKGDEINTSIYKKLKERVEANGSKLYSVRLPSGEKGVASVFINHSRRFPRFEIGIWKFIDLHSIHDNKNNISCKVALHGNKVRDADGIIDGFGIDAFLDYLGTDGVEETPINYWIWVKDGKIHYWSYPEERLIPRKKPGKTQKPMQAVLLTTEHMTKAYGNPVEYTPFTNDDNLRKPEQVLAERFSLPAKVLLSCF